MYRSSVRRKNIILAILIVMLVGMTIGYSALSQYLTINGTSNITSDFKVLFTDIQEGTMNGATTVNKEITAPTTATFQVKLDKPGSSAEYNVTVQNQGKLNAYLESIEGIDEANEKAPTDITFKLSGITRYTKLQVNESKTFKVIVTFDESATSLPEESKQLTLKLNFAQDSGNAPEPEPEVKTMTQYLIENKLQDSVLDGDNGLVAINNSGEITTDSNPREYRYIGPNPDNYVQFNNELWRVIGIFDGKLKLIRNESIGSYSWDSSMINDWSSASLQQLLNSGDYYNRTGSHSSNGLTEDAKLMIETVTWNLGGVTDLNDGLVQSFYNDEHGTNVVEGHTTEWNGKVGLMYLSDNGFATSGGNTTTRSSCLKIEQSSWHSDCYNNSWLNNDGVYWTITPYSGYSYGVFMVGVSDGIAGLGTNIPNASGDVCPSLYLKDNVEYVSGLGTQEDPYIIK